MRKLILPDSNNIDLVIRVDFDGLFSFLVEGLLRNNVKIDSNSYDQDSHQDEYYHLP